MPATRNERLGASFEGTFVRFRFAGGEAQSVFSTAQQAQHMTVHELVEGEPCGRGRD